MTDERKQELRQLLNEAMENLKIQHNLLGWFGLPSLELDRYRGHLNQTWTSYSEESSWIVDHYRLEIESNIESKLLEFIREELDAFIHEGTILSATFFVFGGDRRGAPINRLLDQLLKIAIFRGIEEAISDLERCTKETHGNFQTLALLEGITLEEEIPVFEGVRLVPFPISPSDFPPYFRGMSRSYAPSYYYGKTMLVIDYSISPIFHKPSSLVKTLDEPDVRSLAHLGIGSSVPTGTEDEWYKQRERFKVEVSGGKLPDFNEWDFYTKFCQALSLACNSAVEVATLWTFIAENELFNVNHGMGRGSTSFRIPFRDSTKVGQSEIERAKCYYKILNNPNSNISERLQIPIGRWIESKKNKSNKSDVDKMIDLGVALESLFLPKNKTDQLSLSLRLRAAWHLGENKAHRKKLIDEFDAIYTLRSEAVHNGKLSPNVKIRKGNKGKQGKSVPRSEFIPRAQKLCRDAIIKILKAGEFPDDDYWKDLILGEESS